MVGAVLLLLALIVLPCVESSRVEGQSVSSHDAVSGETGVVEHSHRERQAGSWEGRAAGVAYSEFNHRFVGCLVLLFGFAELGQTLQWTWSRWGRFVLPGALGVVAIFLLVWSDRAAWPIGPLSFLETFFGQDREIIQHKLYGILAAVASLSETFHRIGWVRHSAWAAPVILYGFIGGLLLFAHSHGGQPSNGTIDLQHTILGSLGVGAAVSRAMAIRVVNSSSRFGKVWEFLWAGLIIVMGMQLLFYYE